MNPSEPLAAEKIQAHLPRIITQRLPRLWVHECVDSTNRFLRGQALAGAPSGCVCLAEAQTAGRGRRGRVWVSPPGGNLYLSLLWRFSTGTQSLGGLGLSAGVAVVRTLEGLGVGSLGIKWPNDVYWQDRKLAGILVEAGGEGRGDCFAVVGVGLNVHLDAAARGQIDQPVADLQDIVAHPVGRNALAGALIAELFANLDGFAARGFAACLEEYQRLDLLRGVRVRLLDGTQTIEGVGRGVDTHGALCLSVGGSIRSFTSGEVSVRAL